MHTGIYRSRQAFLFILLLILFVILFFRLFYLQAIRHDFYFKIADDQHKVTIELPPRRGAILDRHMRVLAVNLKCDSVFANPRQIENKKYVARKLASILKINENFVYGRLMKDKSFVWIKRKITAEEAASIKALKIEGLGIIQESKRYYPNRSLACHIIGTVNIDNEGLEGMELYYNKYLKGENGYLISMRDARQKVVELYQDQFIPPKDGLTIVTTIDEVIQHIAERELQKIYEKYHAKAATIIVMSPTTGDILALANLPNYDLNNVGKRSAEAIRNRAINDFFEPGSVFKIVTASAALEENAADFNDKFDCENGEYRIGKRVLHDHTPHGIMTFREVIEKSSNIGTVKVAARFGARKMYEYVRAFGFYDKTGIALPGEVTGMNRPPDKWSGVSMYAIPMGHEVTATAMQLACAISVIADNGYLVRPRIVKEIKDCQGNVVKECPPVAIRRVISPKTAAKMRGLLMGAVKTGTGKKAGVEDYAVGGKTGTAQKVDQGIYSHNRFIASFIGFAPVDRPVISVVVCVDEPRPVYYGGEVAAPVFSSVVNESLKYLNAKASR